MKLGKPLADIFRLLPENINSGEIGGTDNNRNLVRKSSMIRTLIYSTGRCLRPIKQLK